MLHIKSSNGFIYSSIAYLKGICNSFLGAGSRFRLWKKSSRLCQRAKSFAQAFSKACGYLGQSPKPFSAENGIPNTKRSFEGLGELFSRKKVPLNCSHYTNKNLEKVAGGKFFDTLRASCCVRPFCYFLCIILRLRREHFRINTVFYVHKLIVGSVLLDYSV